MEQSPGWGKESALRLPGEECSELREQPAESPAVGMGFMCPRQLWGTGAPGPEQVSPGRGKGGR